MSTSAQLPDAPPEPDGRDEGSAATAGWPEGQGGYNFVVVASRLPVDRVETPAGDVEWRASPGGLVAALEPVVQEAKGAWVGWPGDAGVAPEPFDSEGMHLVGVGLSADEVRDFYEGFCNATLWPLYHDVIAPPEFRRPWWEAYVAVNRRFAEAAAAQAAPGATVWVHDYQLQLVPGMLREMRSDVRIGFFNHIPFPGYEIFAQLPWRRQIVTGLLGADLVGFQRQGDTANFLRACRRAAGLTTRGSLVRVRDAAADDADGRQVRAAAFPISIDTAAYEKLACREDVRARAREIREALGKPSLVLLGVDRLDYTKGILHRLTAYGEVLDEGRLGVPEAVLVLVASPSRERVEQYRLLRDEVEVTVGRINGEHAELGNPPVQYLHQSYPREEMAALFLAADVMLVTSLRDGMNLVAKEYVACRSDETGALVLSEFTGAADELNGAFLVNPHDIEGLKDTIVRAATVPPAEARRRMRSMRRRVREHDVAYWAASFLRALEKSPDHVPGHAPAGTEQLGPEVPGTDHSGTDH
ncbi:MAG TPA: trehalose-6-phosphate synthase [Streptosporangiaceae bacterium]